MGFYRRYLIRRFFWIALLIIAAPGCQQQDRVSTPVTLSPSPFMRDLGHREYWVHQRLTLTNEGPGQPAKQNLWVALIQSVQPYQEVLSTEITPAVYSLVQDEYGNRYAEFDFSGHLAGKSEIVEIDYRLVVNELAYDLTACEGELLDEYTQPELHIESANPQIVALASELSQGKNTACQQVRAFYDYIGNELVYTYNGNNWGAQAALGPMGADCTEYASLLVALSRAQRIPARYFEGLLYLENETEPLARLEHAWADVYLPGIGWVPLDPTLGRSSITRETYFAHHTPEHIIVTIGANPSVLRGSSYWTHLYWPGDSTKIRVEAAQWEIELVGK
jgi:transglutaminase-like putative cysteine protease